MKGRFVSFRRFPRWGLKANYYLNYSVDNSRIAIGFN